MYTHFLSFPPPSLSSGCSSLGNDWEVWLHDGLQYGVHLHCWALPYCPQERRHGHVLLCCTHWQHHSSLRHLFRWVERQCGGVLRCSLLNVIFPTPCLSGVLLVFVFVFLHLLLVTGTYNKALPYILMGSLTIASSIVNWFLPETLNKDLPETVEQMQECQGWVKSFQLSFSWSIREMTWRLKVVSENVQVTRLMFSDSAVD